jgi:hypothetical protein
MLIHPLAELRRAHRQDCMETSAKSEVVTVCSWQRRRKTAVADDLDHEKTPSSRKALTPLTVWPIGALLLCSLIGAGRRKTLSSIARAS